MYALITRATGLAVDLFYRRVHLDGAVPSTGPVLLVANHPNGLIDPVVLARTAGRRVRILAKEPLFRMPVVSWLVRGAGALPVYRAKDGADPSQNQETFRAVEEALAAGDCVALFPEGISHHEPRVMPLKTGAARMALGAARRAGAPSGIVVVPVGLVYRDKARFRSELAVQVGPPIPVDPYAARAVDDERAAVRELTGRIEEALRALTLDLESWEDLPLLEAAHAIWGADDDAGASGEAEERRAARLVALSSGVRRLREERPEELLAVRRSVEEWVARLARLGLRPEDVGARYTLRGVAGFALRNAAALGVGLPAALVGGLAYAAPFWAVHGLTALKRPEPDTAATVKVLLALVLFPLWQAALVSALVATVGVAWGFVVGMALPLAGLYTRRFFDRRKEARRDADAFFRLFLRRRLVRRLEAEKSELRARIEALARVVGASS